MEFLPKETLPKTRWAVLYAAHPWLERYPWRLCRYRRREYLCRFREPVDRLLFLLEGQVSVSLTPPHGRTHIITWSLTEGLICGDVEVALGNTAASADLRSEDGALCLSLPIAPHLEALREDNAFLRYALARLADQMIHQSVYTANNLLFLLETRMAGYMLDHAEDGFFRANLTHTAELLGASYRQLSRVMRGFAEQGLIKKEGGSWRIIGRKELKDMAAHMEQVP